MNEKKTELSPRDKVMAQILLMSMPASTMAAMRFTSIVVLPEPAPASTKKFLSISETILLRDSSSLSRLVIIYLAVRTVIALLANGGVYFLSFMTPMPMLSDTVAGMLSVYCLLGIFGKTEKESR